MCNNQSECNSNEGDQFTIMQALAVAAQVYKADSLNPAFSPRLRVLYSLQSKEALRLAEIMIAKEIAKLRAQEQGGKNV